MCFMNALASCYRIKSNKCFTFMTHTDVRLTVNNEFDKNISFIYNCYFIKKKIVTVVRYGVIFNPKYKRRMIHL